MYDQFKVKAEGVSAEVHRYATKAESLNFIKRFLEQEGLADKPGCHAVWADGPFLSAADKTELAENTGIKFAVSREHAAGARFGLSQVDWALADTGTLVQDSTAVEQRLVSTLSSIHIALIATNRILPDLPTLLTRISPKESGYIAMITGPSRTADIERVLTIGVHGPERLVILFCDELGGGN